MESGQIIETSVDSRKIAEIALEQALGEELTDEQLLQMAEGSCSWGANCRG
jgi:hypothetical protein